MLYAGLFSRIEGYIRDAFLALMLWLDSIVYWLVALVYRVFILVANARLFDFNDENTIGGITERIYTIIGVAMIFVFAYNIILLISNPEKMSDSGDTSLKGIVKNSVISIAIITLLPTIYNYMQLIQMDVLESNVIGNLIMGGSNSFGSKDVKTAGTRVGLSVFQAFLYVVHRGTDADGDLADIDKYFSYKDCKDRLEDVATYNDGNQNLENVCRDYVHYTEEATNTNDLTKLINSDRQEGVFQYIQSGQMEYKFLVSTAVGLLVAYLFISFTFDVSVRAVKLGVLQLIAPFPIIMRITKPHGGIYDKWFKELKDTYIMVFLRLAVIYFAVYMIDYVVANLGSILAAVGNGSQDMNGTFESYIAQVFLIIGLLVFAKQAPKLIETLVGSISGGSWRISKKLNGEDYEYVRRGAAGAGALGSGLAKTGFNTFMKQNADGSYSWRIGKGNGGAQQFFRNAHQQLANLPTNTIGNAFRGIRNGNVDIQNLGNAISQANQETQDILDRREERKERLRENGGLFGQGAWGERYLPGISEVASGLHQLFDGDGEGLKEFGERLKTGNAFTGLGNRLNPSRAFSSAESTALSGLFEEMDATTKPYVLASDSEKIKTKYAADREAVKKSYEAAFKTAAEQRSASVQELHSVEQSLSKIAKELTGSGISRDEFRSGRFGSRIDELEKKIDDYTKLAADRSSLITKRQSMAAAGQDTSAITAQIEKIDGQIKALNINPDLVKDAATAQATKQKLADFKSRRERSKADVDRYDADDNKLRSQRDAELEHITDLEDSEIWETALKKMKDENGQISDAVKKEFMESWQDVRRMAASIPVEKMKAAIKASGFVEDSLDEVYKKFIDGNFNADDLKHLEKLKKQIKKLKESSEIHSASIKRHQERRKRKPARDKEKGRG